MVGRRGRQKRGKRAAATGTAAGTAAAATSFAAATSCLVAFDHDGRGYPRLQQGMFVQQVDGTFPHKPTTNSKTRSQGRGGTNATSLLADITPRVFWSEGFFHRGFIYPYVSATHCFDDVSTAGAVGGERQVFILLQASIGGVEKGLLGVVRGKVRNVVGIGGGRKRNV